MRTTTHIRYVAEPKHVREVTLTGTTDLGFWSDYLKSEGLAPVRYGDDGQIVVVAAEMVYLGLRFTEVSFSVRAGLIHSSSCAGVRLLHAFTTSRIFAWCERALFATPYSHGKCCVSVHRPTAVRLDAQGERVLRAEMSSVERPVIRAGDESWEGPVFLPSRCNANDRRLFFGRLRGHTVVHPFSTGDQFAIEPSAGGGALRLLADSQFHPKEWVVRADATHGKSKTYCRTEVFTDDHAA